MIIEVVPFKPVILMGDGLNKKIQLETCFYFKMV